jgi:REP element-mobilizing transposase RayT
MATKFRNKYRIESTRLRSWDYSSNGAYFLTIYTANRRHYFGEIIDRAMHLSRIGEYVKKCWLEIPDHFPYFYLDEFQIMLNHLHGIVLIEKPYMDNTAQAGHAAAETGHALPLPRQQTNTNEIKQRPHFRFRNQGKNTISAMVGSVKSAVTKYCNENELPFKWQGRFHDHIIRNNEEFLRIKNYICNNPSRWKDG